MKGSVSHKSLTASIVYTESCSYDGKMTAMLLVQTVLYLAHCFLFTKAINNIHGVLIIIKVFNSWT